MGFKELINMFERMSGNMIISVLKSAELFMYENGNCILRSSLDDMGNYELKQYYMSGIERKRIMQFNLKVLGEDYLIQNIKQVESLLFWKEWGLG